MIWTGLPEVVPVVDGHAHYVSPILLEKLSVGSARPLFGSDYPFEMLDEAGLGRIGDIGGWDAKQREVVLGANALALIGSAAIGVRSTTG